MTQTRWITLGTCGGPFQRTEAFQISNALVVDEDVYLFDVGNGVLRRLAEAGIDPARLRGVFLTHHHPDHLADLGIVLLTHWLGPGDRRLVVGGPHGTGHLVAGLADAYRHTELTEAPDKPGIVERVTVHEAERPADHRLVELYRDEAILVEAIEVAHFRSPSPGAARPHAIGLRVTTPDRVIAYTGDTGMTPALVPLAQDANLLVSEVVDVPRITEDLRTRFAAAPAIVDRVEYNMRNNHLTPEEIGSVAASAHVRQILLTHFVPYPAPESVAGLVCAAGAGAVPVIAARDLGEY